MIKLNSEDFKQFLTNNVVVRELKNKINSADTKYLDENEILDAIFPKIFTKDLNEVLNLFTDKQTSSEITQIQFALLRVYLNFFNKLKHSSTHATPKKQNIDGKTMIYNLFKYYVSQFESKDMGSLFKAK